MEGDCCNITAYLRCEACPEGEYISEGACAECNCVTANTVLSDPGCTEGQCRCQTGGCRVSDG